MTKPWAMARVASRRQLPKPRKMMAPVGERMAMSRANPDNPQLVQDVTCEVCGYHVCSCEEDDNPDMQFTLDEREKMARIGGTAGYLEVCRDRMAAISGLNSVARGESEQPKPEPIGRNYKFPVNVMYYDRDGVGHLIRTEDVPSGARTLSFDDHARHATEHALVAERLGYCGLCHSREHKLAECPTMKAHLEALGLR